MQRIGLRMKVCGNGRGCEVEVMMMVNKEKK